MKKKYPQKEFIGFLMEKFPKKVMLADFISETLCIEKDSAYRRIRGDVQFSLEEACLIAEKLNISIDEAAGFASPKNRPLSFRIINYIEPEEIDYKMYEEYLEFLNSITQDSTSKLAITAKMFPPTVYLRHDALRKFYLLKWIYQYGDKSPMPKFSEVTYSDRLLKLFDREVDLYNSIASTDIVFHKYLFLRITQDFRYFINLGLIEEEDLRLLKQELLTVLDELNLIGQSGKNEKGNETNLYISNMNFDTPTHYIESKEYTFTMIRAFTINDIKTFDHVTFEWAKKYVESLKRTSILITKCGDMIRNQHFNEQRELINAFTY